jgi:hypothetical protein
MITKKHVEFDKYFIKEKIEAKKKHNSISPIFFCKFKTTTLAPFSSIVTQPLVLVISSALIVVDNSAKKKTKERSLPKFSTKLPKCTIIVIL